MAMVVSFFSCRVFYCSCCVAAVVSMLSVTLFSKRSFKLISWDDTSFVSFVYDGVGFIVLEGGDVWDGVGGR